MDTTAEKPSLVTPSGVEVNKESEKVELVLPRVENPTFQYNNSTHTFWFGIPVDKTEPFVASCIIDSMKMQYIQAFQTMLREKQEMQSKIVTPGMLNRMREAFVRNHKK